MTAPEEPRYAAAGDDDLWPSPGTHRVVSDETAAGAESDSTGGAVGADQEDSSYQEPSTGKASSSSAPETDGSHRGAFGEFGGESDAFIERTFRERILVVGVELPESTRDEVETSLDELELLVDTAGADVVGRVIQRRERPDPATYVGRGKVKEILELAEAHDCDTVVFDDELTPAQQGNLEKALKRSAIDRTAVILDIFAQNAHSQEGKAQVQLALFRYRLPRLRGRGLSLSQQAGGIGARRGPGETQLEIDRRRITRQIHKLEADLTRTQRHRSTQRKSRGRSGLRHIVIVGYTNAGKSTLLNRLTDAGVLVEDRLFATLDATTRKLQLAGGETVLLTDTVGFVKKLPHHLVEAFRSTLGVALEADLLVHVVDGAGPDPEGSIAAVHSVLSEIGTDGIPEMFVFNKADLSPNAVSLAASHRTPNTTAVAVSAVTGEGIDEFLECAAEAIRADMPTATLEIPYSRGDLIASLHRRGEIIEEKAGDIGLTVRARLPQSMLAGLREFTTSVEHPIRTVVAQPAT
jgi:GTP-binding protein HflX